MRPPCTPLPGRANLFAAPRTAPSTPVSPDDVNYTFGPRAAAASSYTARMSTDSRPAASSTARFRRLVASVMSVRGYQPVFLTLQAGSSATAC